MKYRRKAVVVEVVERSGVYAVRSEPGGPLHAISEQEIARDFERVPDDWLVGCSCSFNESRHVFPNDTGLSHASTCPLY